MDTPGILGVLNGQFKDSAFSPSWLLSKSLPICWGTQAHFSPRGSLSNLIDPSPISEKHPVVNIDRLHTQFKLYLLCIILFLWQKTTDFFTIWMHSETLQITNLVAYFREWSELVNICKQGNVDNSFHCEIKFQSYSVFWHWQTLSHTCGIWFSHNKTK